MGIEVGSTRVGLDHVSVELDFTLEYE